MIDNDDMNNIPLLAVQAQAIASAEAQANQDAMLITPPAGCQPLTSIRTIAGNPADTAIVLGYTIKTESVRDVYGPDGHLRFPGDAGYYDLQCARLTCQPLPKGWRIEERLAAVLYALIDGNPILLEEQAKDRGYSRACAVSPKWLSLGELPCSSH